MGEQKGLFENHYTSADDPGSHKDIRYRPFVSPPPKPLTDRLKNDVLLTFMKGTLIILTAVILAGIPYNLFLLTSSMRKVNDTLSGLSDEVSALNEHLSDIDTKISLVDENLMRIEDAIRSLSSNKTAATVSNKGWLGITVTDGEASSDDGKNVIKGVAVIDVAKDSPAMAAGLEKGDLILAIGDEAVSDTESFLTLMDKTKPGDVITLDIIHNGWRNEDPVKVTLGDISVNHN